MAEKLKMSGPPDASIQYDDGGALIKKKPRRGVVRGIVIAVGLCCVGGFFAVGMTGNKKKDLSTVDRGALKDSQPQLIISASQTDADQKNRAAIANGTALVPDPAARPAPASSAAGTPAPSEGGPVLGGGAYRGADGSVRSADGKVVVAGTAPSQQEELPRTAPAGAAPDDAQLREDAIRGAPVLALGVSVGGRGLLPRTVGPEASLSRGPASTQAAIAAESAAMAQSEAELARLSAQLRGLQPPGPTGQANAAGDASRFGLGGALLGSSAQTASSAINAGATRAFLESRAQLDENDYKPYRAVPAQSRLVLFEGTAVTARMIRPINSEIPGLLQAQLIHDVYDSTTGKCVLWPRGTIVNGEYQSDLQIGQERMGIIYSRLIFPNGDTSKLGGSRAADIQGQSGVPAQINTHFWKRFGSGAAISLLSLALSPDERKVVTSSSASGTQSTSSVISTALSEVVKTELDRYKSLAPTGFIEANTEITIVINKDFQGGQTCVSRR